MCEEDPVAKAETKIVVISLDPIPRTEWPGVDYSPVPEACKYQRVAQSLDGIFTSLIGVGGPFNQFSGPPLPDF